MLKTAAGARYDKMFRAHSLELTVLAINNKAVRDAGASLLKVAGRFFSAKDEVLPRKIAKEDLTDTDKALAVVRKHASAKLKSALDTALADLKRLQGKPLTDAFKTLDALAGGGRAKSAVKPAVTAVGRFQEGGQEEREERVALQALRATRGLRCCSFGPLIRSSSPGSDTSRR